MRKLHMHTPGWMRHIHKPDWHTVGLHLDHLIHDPRFWAALALAVLLALMVLTTIFAGSGGYSDDSGHTPIYPYMP